MKTIRFLVCIFVFFFGMHTSLGAKTAPKKNKQIECVVYGNCQGHFVAEFLKKAFPEHKYTQITNWFSIAKGIPLPEKDFKKADIFIYQPLKGHGKYDTDYVLKHYLKKGCICVSFPYIYSLCYFPDHFDDKNNLKTVSDSFLFGKFASGHRALATCIMNGFSVEEVIVKSLQDDFLTREFIMQQFYYTLNVLREREKYTDVKLADFIEKNYAQTKLFHNVKHPTNFLLKEVVRQILSQLNWKTNIDRNEMFHEEFLDMDAPIIYPCVAKALNLKFDTSNAIWNEKKISYVEYITEYMRWLYPEYYYKNQ